MACWILAGAPVMATTQPYHDEKSPSNHLPIFSRLKFQERLFLVDLLYLMQAPEVPLSLTLRRRLAIRGEECY
jgi:hypothetical protein